ncbi:hypothetical protein E2C01_066613 [Portunus trituberculatus]|uniref:Uncharacterized protein n=1 Tax=Portunus trituberculatus TaxID=210409 RepID=A0A5B7HLZ6_PORTR|nr:hypothetical protein [Portunus trituberculatus]
MEAPREDQARLIPCQGLVWSTSNIITNDYHSGASRHPDARLNAD